MLLKLFLQTDMFPLQVSSDGGPWAGIGNVGHCSIMNKSWSGSLFTCFVVNISGFIWGFAGDVASLLYVDKYQDAVWVALTWLWFCFPLQNVCHLLWPRIVGWPGHPPRCWWLYAASLAFCFGLGVHATHVMCHPGIWVLQRLQVLRRWGDLERLACV